MEKIFSWKFIITIVIAGILAFVIREIIVRIVAFFLDKVYDNSLYVADKYNFKIIECSKDGVLRSIDDISREVYSIVESVIN